MKLRTQAVLLKIRASMLEFNLFDRHSLHPSSIERDYLATHLYICLLAIAMSILIIYTLASMQTITMTVTSPSVERYEQLHETYRDSLQCPYSVLSVPHENLMTIEVTFHQLCESDFVQPWWYESLARPNTSEQRADFTHTASSHFRTSATLCDVANLTLIGASRLFLQTLFVTAQVRSRDWFFSQTAALINTFINASRNDFLYTISVTNAVLQGEQYASKAASAVYYLRASFPRPLNRV